jgi:hypothetical protein
MVGVPSNGLYARGYELLLILVFVGLAETWLLEVNFLHDRAQ